MRLLDPDNPRENSLQVREHCDLAQLSFFFSCCPYYSIEQRLATMGLLAVNPIEWVLDSINSS